MESLFAGFSWEALFGVVLIDLILSGDNAVVIALAARNLPKEQQKKAIFWGTFGAVALRVLFAAVVVFLLKIPLLTAVGGLLLIHVAYGLLVTKEGEHNIAGGATIWAAIRTIIYADAIMSLDNVIALAGVAHGNLMMILLGILISIPIIIWGSQLILKAMEKFPIIVYIGAGILLWTAGKMILHDKTVEKWLDPNVWVTYGFPVALIVFVLGFAFWKNKKKNA